MNSEIPVWVNKEKEAEIMNNIMASIIRIIPVDQIPNLLKIGLNDKASLITFLEEKIDPKTIIKIQMLQGKY